MIPPPMRVAIYARVSKRDSSQDVTNQLNQLRSLSAQNSWEIVAEYIDNASGKNGERAQLKAMFAGAAARSFDLLLFWSLIASPAKAYWRRFSTCRL